MTASTFLASETTSNYLTLGNCLNGCSGCSNGTMNAAGPFTGAIDDWRIYSRELSSNDISNQRIRIWLNEQEAQVTNCSDYIYENFGPDHMQSCW
ncbi:unnamed protein product, partial [Rotaria sp. Silwood1]